MSIRCAKRHGRADIVQEDQEAGGVGGEGGDGAKRRAASSSTIAIIRMEPIGSSRQRSPTQCRSCASGK